MPVQTSAFGASIPVEGTVLYLGNGSSPETFFPICNVTDFALPIMSETADVTNIGDLWRRRRSTLKDMGKISFGINYIPEEPTHRNGAPSSGVSEGLMYLLVNGYLRDFQLQFADGNSSTDAWPAYVTGFQITGKVGGVVTAKIELSNDGAPSLV